MTSSSFLCHWELWLCTCQPDYYRQSFRWNFENGSSGLPFFEIKLVKIPQELTESEPKAYPKHQRERWTNTSSQTIKLQLTSRVSSPFPKQAATQSPSPNQTNWTHRSVNIKTFKNWTAPNIKHKTNEVRDLSFFLFFSFFFPNNCGNRTCRYQRPFADQKSRRLINAKACVI